MHAHHTHTPTHISTLHPPPPSHTHRSFYSLSDVEAMDIGFYNSLKYVLENDPEPLELTFTVLEESFGEVGMVTEKSMLPDPIQFHSALFYFIHYILRNVILLPSQYLHYLFHFTYMVVPIPFSPHPIQMVELELVPRGSETAVTEDNKQEYVDLMVQWRLARRIGPQTESLVRGLKEMLPLAYLEPFDAQELEWVIAGTPEINIDDWKENTLYWGGVCMCGHMYDSGDIHPFVYILLLGYHKNHTMVRWFWEVVESYSNEQKLRLLQVQDIMWMFYCLLLTPLPSHPSPTPLPHFILHLLYFHVYCLSLISLPCSLSQGLLAFHLRVSRHYEGLPPFSGSPLIRYMAHQMHYPCEPV